MKNNEDRRNSKNDRRDPAEAQGNRADERRDSPEDRRKSRQDRRKYKRIKKKFILTYHLLNDPTTSHDASQIQDISEHGTCFTTSNSFPVMSKMGIKITTPFFDEHPYITGKVVSSIEKIKGNVYETHLVFDPLDDLAITVLNRILEES